MKQISIGIDIGGTKTAIGLVNQSGQIIAEESFPTPSQQLNPTKDQDISDKLLKGYTNHIGKTIQQLTSQIKDEITLKGIGIGAPNGNRHTGTIDFAPNLPFSPKTPLCNTLAEVMPEIPLIRLTNDANAAALGEKFYGGAKQMNHFVMYTLGTGVGSGLYSNGNLVYGYDGLAGECGHNTVIPNGRLCGCGGRGHLETYCSASGIKRTAFELLARDNENSSLLCDYSYKTLTSKHIYDAAIKGDKIALEVFRYTGEILGQALADTVHHLSPEAIFLFGGPLAAGDLILNPTQKSLQKHLLPIFKNRDIPVLASQLPLGHAAILGASALVW